SHAGRATQRALMSGGVLLALFLVAMAGKTIVRRHDVADADYIAFGAQAQFGCVGKMGGACWGTIGTPIFVLTADHCTKQTVLTINAQNHSVVRTFTPGGSDSGLLQLATPVTDVTPAALYGGADERGLVGVSVGFGSTGTGLTGDTGTGKGV